MPIRIAFTTKIEQARQRQLLRSRLGDKKRLSATNSITHITASHEVVQAEDASSVVSVQGGQGFNGGPYGRDAIATSGVASNAYGQLKGTGYSSAAALKSTASSKVSQYHAYDETFLVYSNSNSNSI